MEPNTTWATSSDVLLYTGKSVDGDDLVRAQAVVDMAVGRQYGELDVPTSDTRSLYWLRLAVAYQAAWMEAQPDMYSRSAVTDIDQDGAAVSFAPAGQVLAPLAQMAIGRLRWKRSRSVRVQPAFAARPVDFLLESSDDYGTWRPL